MAEVRSRERWAYTSALLALTANIHRDQRKKPTRTSWPISTPTGAQIAAPNISVIGGQH